VTHVPTGGAEPPAARGARDTGTSNTGPRIGTTTGTGTGGTGAQSVDTRSADAHNVGTSALSHLDALFAPTGAIATATNTDTDTDTDTDTERAGTGSDLVREAAGSTLPVLELVDIQQIYGTGDAAVHALRGITLSVHAGDYVAIMGPSGSGKSTLMNLLGCLDIASSGVYSLAGNDVATLDEAQLAVVRNKEIGFIFQSFNLVPRMSAVANVELPLVYGGVKRAERRRRALEALDMVGLGHRANHQPQELSGGQQQRVAIARALVTNPTLVLADEPTGNLDSESTEEILGIFDTLASQGRTIVIITHEDHVAERAHRVLAVSDGLIVVDRPARKEVLV
jgi:putative ABC transport system ATP-binding protein